MPLLTLTRETTAWACASANAEHRSLSNFLAHIVEQYRESQQKALSNLAATREYQDHEQPTHEPA